jgi:hypothetical protein
MGPKTVSVCSAVRMLTCRCVAWMCAPRRVHPFLFVRALLSDATLLAPVDNPHILSPHPPPFPACIVFVCSPPLQVTADDDRARLLQTTNTMRRDTDIIQDAVRTSHHAIDMSANTMAELDDQTATIRRGLDRVCTSFSVRVGAWGRVVCMCTCVCVCFSCWLTDCY